MKKLFKKSTAMLLCMIMLITAIQIAAYAADIPVLGKFTVTANGNKFTVTRTSDFTTERVYYRTKGLTAIPGIHFTNKTGSLTFQPGQKTKTVTVTETATSSATVADQCQTIDNARKYAFEIYDNVDNILGSCTRTMNYNANIENGFHKDDLENVILVDCSVATQSKTPYPAMYIQNGVEHLLTSSIYEAHALYDTTTVTDAGYQQGVYTLETEDLFPEGSRNIEYINETGAFLLFKVFLHVKEKDDGYQYIQILLDNETTYDTGCTDGWPGDMELSKYLCGFEKGKKKTDTSYTYFAFPYDESDNGADEMYTGSGANNGFVYQQSGFSIYNKYMAFIAPTNQNRTLCFRLNASGSLDDDWVTDSLGIRAFVIDGDGPESKSVYVQQGNYRPGTPFTVSLRFNEAIRSCSGVLKTSFGDLSYISGYGTNILTFGGTVPNDPGLRFRITGSTITAQDITGNSTSNVFASSTYYNAHYNAYVYSPVETPCVDGVYQISNAENLKEFTDIVNGTNGKTANPSANAILLDDINLNPANSVVMSTEAIGKTDTGYSGSFNGNGHIIGSLNCVYESQNYSGLFGKIASGGSVTDLTVSFKSITFPTNRQDYGLLCTENSGTIEGCKVVWEGENPIVINHDTASDKVFFGPVAGCNRGVITECLVMGSMEIESDNVASDKMFIGGLIGRIENNAFISSCLNIADISYVYDSRIGILAGYLSGVENVIRCYGKSEDPNSRKYVAAYSCILSDDIGGAVNSQQLASGEVTVLLNGWVTDGTQGWYQNIDNGETVDSYPKFTGGTVYKNRKTFTNRPSTTYDVNSDNTENVLDIKRILEIAFYDTGTPEERAKADINGDGIVNAFDAAMLDKIFYSPDIATGDVNQDGSVDIGDYTLIKMDLAGTATGGNTLINTDQLDSDYSMITILNIRNTIITPWFYSADINSDSAVDAFDMFYLDKRINNLV